MPEEKRITATERIVNIGLVANIVLALLKTLAGIIGNSAGLLADGINSTSDVVYYGFVKFFMKWSARPADREHPYGHGQMESIAALVVGSFVVTTAVGIFYKSVSDVYEILRFGIGEAATAGRGILIIALGSVIVKIVLTRMTLRVGRHSGHTAVIALARDHRNDIFSATAVAIGIVFARLGFSWMDPLAGALVAFIILHTGIGILRESSAELMDTLPDRKFGNALREAIDSHDQVKTIEEIRTHRFGPYYVVNLTIGIDGNLSVAEGDRIASEVEQEIHRMIGLVRRVYVHYHPVHADPGRLGADFRDG